MKHLFALALTFSVAASASSRKFEYRYSSREYGLERTTTSFVLRLPHVEKKVAITKCNEPIIEDFWSALEAKTKALQLVTRGTRLPAAADLKVDGEPRQILEFDAGFRYFYDLPSLAILAISESEKKCAK